MVIVDNQQLGLPQASAPPVYDVVFVVEATAALGGYFDSMRSSYILPTLEYFNGGPPDEIDYGCDYSCTMYTLVLYRAGDSAPGPASSCLMPTTSTHNFIQSLDNISFDGGSGEAYSHMSEGLSTALQVFDDLKNIRGQNVTTQKHCIIVCNSPPYQLPSGESYNYSGLLPDQLAQKLAEREVNISVMAPRKMIPLMKMFDKVNSDTPASTMRNFTHDSRHLVLLKEFALQDISVEIENNDEIFSYPSKSDEHPLNGTIAEVLDRDPLLRRTQSSCHLHAVQHAVPHAVPTAAVGRNPDADVLSSCHLHAVPHAVPTAAVGRNPDADVLSSCHLHAVQHAVPHAVPTAALGRNPDADVQDTDIRSEAEPTPAKRSTANNQKKKKYRLKHENYKVWKF